MNVGIEPLCCTSKEAVYFMHQDAGLSKLGALSYIMRDFDAMMN